MDLEEQTDRIYGELAPGEIPWNAEEPPALLRRRNAAGGGATR